MTTKLLEQGRKYAMTAVFLVLATGVMVGSFVLALTGKLTSEWGQICMFFLPSVSAATIGFQASHAYTDGKAIAVGRESPE